MGLQSHSYTIFMWGQLPVTQYVFKKWMLPATPRVLREVKVALALHCYNVYMGRAGFLFVFKQVKCQFLFLITVT
jgi:hypothetical protein